MSFESRMPFENLMLKHGTSAFGVGVDFAVLVRATAVLVLIGSWVYPRVVT
jgi:hypothetical protein